MPRHDRAYGEHSETRQKGGNLSRRTRTPKNTYLPKQSRRRIDDTPAALDRVTELDMGRHGGSSKGSSTPQTPKPQPKGGSKPTGTIRRRTRLGEATA
jgi:hypothetical protein